MQTSAPVPLGVEAGYIEPGSVFDSDRADEIAAARRAGGGMTPDDDIGYAHGMRAAVIFFACMFAAIVAFYVLARLS